MMESIGWVDLAMQAGGAMAVCAMFLWHLKGQAAHQESSRTAFMEHLARKDDEHTKAMTQLMEYLKQRDAQSKEIAMNGHAALRENTEAIGMLREEMRERMKSVEQKAACQAQPSRREDRIE